ncbi:MAG: transcriptional regulator [Verrucomicrobia bacterium 21-51-4]|nr:MAG: transcriptional regulator [Verrucomicrobia bacterium 21-51-4]HQU08798.1 YerC/YecD family TrpR-related protein [Opitutales bacterium]
MNITSLSDIFTRIKNAHELNAFLKDLCTPQELKAMEERWRVCQLLHTEQHSYREIHDLTGASLATITRIARFLKDEPHGGYRLMLQRQNPKRTQLSSKK